MAAENTADPLAPNTIVLIHGLWMTPLSWEHWIERYEARGFRVFAPAWPGMDGDIDLEAPSIGWQLFALDSSQYDSKAFVSKAFVSSLDTYDTRLSTEALRVR